MTLAALPIGGSLRFAAGASNALRSSTWMVLGGTNGRDVYLGQRSDLHRVKFSLHASGQWRFAYTSEAVASGTPDWETGHPDLRSATEDPRVITRLPVPPTVNGWQHALDIVVSEPGLQVPFREKPVKRTPVSWWPAPRGEFIRAFGVFISTADVEYRAATFADPIVGAIEMPSRAHVVVITKVFHDPQLVDLVRRERQNFEESGFRQEGGSAPLMLRINRGNNNPATIFDFGLEPSAAAE